MSSFQAERTRDRKLKILRTAANLFNRKGYYETTIEDIANELRMTKGAIYYYVDSKEDLLFQCHTLVATENILELQKVVNSDDNPVVKLEKAIRAIISYIVSETAVFSVVNRFNMPSGEMREKIIQQRDEFEQLFQSILEEGMKTGDFKIENVKLMRLLLVGSINFIPNWFKPIDDESNQEMVDFFTNKLLRLVLNPEKYPL